MQNSEYKERLVPALMDLCELMQKTDANEFVIEMGLSGGQADGTRYLVHVLRQCPEDAVEEEEDEG